MSQIQPKANENSLDFVERADELEVDETAINEVLREHFKLTDDGEMKALKLQSKVFWKKFYLEHVSELLKRGGSRYSALRFVQRKNKYAEERRKMSDEDINKLIDSVGKWSR